MLRIQVLHTYIQLLFHFQHLGTSQDYSDPEAKKNPQGPISHKPINLICTHSELLKISASKGLNSHIPIFPTGLEILPFHIHPIHTSLTSNTQ